MSLFLSSIARFRANKTSLGLFNRIIYEPVNVTSCNARDSSTIVSTEVEFIPEKNTDITKQKLSRAAIAYLEKAKQYDDMIREARAEYSTGMRHLANMMGENPDTFTQADANVAVEYLFPSGIYDKKARPSIKPPEEVFPARKRPQFDRSGRPLLSLFYTGFPHFYQLCRDGVEELRKLDEIEDYQIRIGRKQDESERLDLNGSAWLTKETLQDMIIEDIKDTHYAEYIKMMDRLAAHPYAYKAKEFIMKNRYMLPLLKELLPVLIPKIGEDGRSYSTTYECKRKTAIAEVTVISAGTGKITINDEDISYFKYKQSRDQVSSEPNYSTIFHLSSI